MESKEYVAVIGNFLAEHGTKMSAEELAAHLNRNDFRTGYNTPYAGGRGVYKLIHATYDWLVAQGKQKDADAVASAFTKTDGSYAYER